MPKLRPLVLIIVLGMLSACGSNPPRPDPRPLPAQAAVTEPDPSPHEALALEESAATPSMPPRQVQPTAELAASDPPSLPEPPAAGPSLPSAPLAAPTAQQEAASLEAARPAPPAAPEPASLEAARPAASVARPAPSSTEPLQSPSVAEPVLPSAQAEDSGRVLAGQLQVLAAGRPVSFAATHLAQTVVAWVPDQPVDAPPMPEQQIVTRGSRFLPQVSAVTRGTPVRFPNFDSIQHNVFSLSEGNQFDVGMYGPGEGRTHVFESAGIVEIYCNVHPNMAAFMIVLDTPWFTFPDEDGRFRLEGLPDGLGELWIWNYRAEPPLQRLRVGTRTGLPDGLLTVDIRRPAVPQHLNKHGQPYRGHGHRH